MAGKFHLLYRNQLLKLKSNKKGRFFSGFSIYLSSESHIDPRKTIILYRGEPGLDLIGKDPIILVAKAYLLPIGEVQL
jgi:hypothetical protein